VTRDGGKLRGPAFYGALFFFWTSPTVTGIALDGPL
jgi:hypothetical protein